MNVYRHFVLFLTIVILSSMLGCGGGAQSDTAGALTMAAPTAKDEGRGIYTVSTKVTYAPPAGKNAQGVKVVVTATGMDTSTHTLTSGSNSFDYSFIVIQDPSLPTGVRIEASIGSMTASVFTIIPKLTIPALSAPTAPVAFLAADPVNTTIKTVAFTGGTAPFSVVSSSPNIGATVTVTDTVFGGGFVSIQLLNSNPGGVSTDSTVTLTANGVSAVIPVTSFQ